MVRIIVSGAAGPARRSPPKPQAQTWPARPVRIVVPSPPAGGTDIVARVLAEHFSKAFGQQFFVENRPGAGNMIGIESVARAAPDGYTFLMVASTLSLNSVLYKKVSYDPIKDFAPITLAASAPNVLIVNPSVPAKTLAEFIALAKKQPGKLTYGTPGHRHLAAHVHGAAQEHGRHRPAAHPLSRHGAGADRRDERADHRHVLDRAVSASRRSTPARCARSALSTAKRSGAMPDVPPIAEAGVPGYEATQWYGFLAPAGTPPAIIARIHAEAVKALHSAEMREKLAHDGAEPVGSTPEEFAAHIKNELESGGKVAKAAGIEPQ